jgi:hypothetical protein
MDTRAYVTPYPFERADPVDTARPFIEARLTEMATIGLRFEAPIGVEVGQRMLVVLILSDERQVEAMGIVRRCWGRTERGHDFAVELVGLHNEEVDELARETEAAKNADRPQGPPVEAVPTAEG